MKKKTIWSLVLALALTVTAIGTATSAFAATSVPMEPVTKIATENEDAIWEQIEAIEEKSDAIFQRNVALWEKLDEICNALPDDYDFTNFDEAAFIRNTDALTEAEKETLLADIKELDELDAQMEALYAQLPDCDNMPLYEKALEKADPKVLDEIDTLEQEYDRVCEKHADLWDKVDEAYLIFRTTTTSTTTMRPLHPQPELPDRRGKGRADRRLQPSYGDRQPAVRAVQFHLGRYRLRKRHLPPLTERRYSDSIKSTSCRCCAHAQHLALLAGGRMGHTIYLADDEKSIRELLHSFLASDGYTVRSFESGDALLEAFRQEPAELVILDIMMPGTDGLTVCRELRSVSDIPIILLTAKDSELDYVMGISQGSDDYLTKPFVQRYY